MLPSGGTHLQLQAGKVSAVPANIIGAKTGGTWTVVPGSSSVTVTTGPSGLAEVVVSGDIATGNAGEYGVLGVAVDGGSKLSMLTAAQQNGWIEVQNSFSGIWVGLAPGSHTWQLWYQTLTDSTGPGVNFSQMSLAVSPL